MNEQSFPIQVYAKTQAEIFELKSRLPKDSVAELAKEVLQRVAALGQVIELPEDKYSRADVEHLSHALISDDPSAGALVIQNLRADGATIDAVYLKYLAGAARQLGEWWEEDRLSFADVTIGTSRIYAIMRTLSNLFISDDPEPQKIAIFASVPDESHTLGVRMATDLFRKEGWEIDLKIGYAYDDLLDQIEKSKCRLIGLSAGGAHSADLLARLVIAIRIIRPNSLIFVSGQILQEAGDLVALMNVDAVADDVPSARAAMDELWERTRPANRP